MLLPFGGVLVRVKAWSLFISTRFPCWAKGERDQEGDSAWAFIADGNAAKGRSIAKA